MTKILECLKRAKAGDKDAINKIVDRYMPPYYCITGVWSYIKLKREACWK